MISFILGAFAGIIVILFMQGASKSRREQEIYMEGFIDGQNAPRRYIPYKMREKAEPESEEVI